MQPRITLCSVCHSQMPAGQSYCQNCGSTLCPHCRELLPQRSRFCPKCGFLVVAEQQIITPPAAPQVSGRPQAIPVPRAAMAAPSAQQPALTPLPQPSLVNPAGQRQRNCPKCGAIIDHDLGRCTGCGLLFGVKHRAMQLPTTSTMPIPRPPVLWPQGSPGQQSQAAHNVMPQYNNPRYSAPAPTPGQHPNYMPSAAMPQPGMLMPIPRIAPPIPGVMSAGAPVQPRPYQYHGAPTTPIEPPAKAPGKGGFSGFAIAMIVVICLLVGGGIYYFMNETSVTQPIESTIDTNGAEIPSDGNSTQKPVVAADKTAPKISGVNVANITESGAIVTWKTDEPATGQIKYAISDNVTFTTPEETDLEENHIMTLTKLTSGTTYSFTIISKDAAGNKGTSAANQTFTTLSSIPIGCDVGDRAPDFTVKNLDGEDVAIKMSDFRGKIVMINFWAIWCEPCTEEMPYIQAVSENWSSQDLAIFAIAAKDKENITVVNEFISENEYTFPAYYDSQGQAKSLYSIPSWPTTFFIDTKGIIRYIQFEPFSDQAEIESRLNSLQTSGKYVGSTESNKYHYPTCSHAQNILPEHEIWFESANDAQAQGYSPCGHCNPPTAD